MSLKNQRGQSLVQVLISVAIMGILMAAMATMQTSQQRENRALSEKLSALDLQRSMSSALASGTVCTYILNNPVVTFNSTLVAAGTAQVTPITSPLYASVVGGFPGPVLAQVGPAHFPNSLPIQSITLTVSSGSGTSFLGSIDVNFDQTQLTRSIHSASASVLLSVNATTPANATITSCAGVGGGSGAVSSSEDGQIDLPTGSGAKLATPYVTLNHGIFFVDFYDCIATPLYGGTDSVSADYFQSASAEASSGSIASGSWNFRFSHSDIYNGHGFILKVLSPSASVRFFIQMGAGGTLTYGTGSPCSSFYYTKISN
jgi:type II secretory pathway pseudopilin PulG